MSKSRNPTSRGRLLIGAHMSVAGGAAAAFARAEAVGCACMQIFTRNPRQWRGNPLAEADVRAFKREQRRTGIWSVVSHANYLINLASRDRALRRRSGQAIGEELAHCELLGLSGVVVHPGSHKRGGVEDGIKRAADAINAAFDLPTNAKAKLILETTAGQGDSVGCRFEHLAGIIERIEQRRRVGVCFDTCHVFAAGYDMRTPKAYEETWAEFDAAIGRGRLKVVHLNDCKGSLGSNLDRHEHIGRGKLGRQAFQLVMQDSRLARVAKILETPKGPKDDGRCDRRNLGRLRRLAAGP